MKKLLAIPNDPTTAYFRNPEEDFLGEFNPKYKNKRIFDEVRFLNWRDKKDITYFGIFSSHVLKEKEKANKLYRKLARFELPFDSSEVSFTKIFEQDEGNIEDIVKKFGPNLIRAFNTHFAVEMGLIARRYASAPLMVSAHDPTRLTPSVKYVDALVCESYELKDLCIEEFKVDPAKISVIHNGIDLDFFKPLKEEEIAKYVPKEFLDSPYKIFSSSRLVRGKNIENLLKAIDAVRLDLPGIVHLHLGDMGSQPDQSEAIEKLKNDLDLEGTSYFLGAKNKIELPSYYSWADVFILPTLWEGLSRVMRESLACGTPVIATNYGSSAEIIQNNYNGLSIDPTDSGEIAEGILRFFKNNSLKKELSKNARLSSEKYSLEKSMEMYSNLYNKLLK